MNFSPPPPLRIATTKTTTKKKRRKTRRASTTKGVSKRTLGVRVGTEERATRETSEKLARKVCTNERTRKRGATRGEIDREPAVWRTIWSKRKRRACDWAEVDRLLTNGRKEKEIQILKGWKEGANGRERDSRTDGNGEENCGHDGGWSAGVSLIGKLFTTTTISDEKLEKQRRTPRSPPVTTRAIRQKKAKHEKLVDELEKQLTGHKTCARVRTFQSKPHRNFRMTEPSSVQPS